MSKLISLMYHDVYEKSVTESGFQNIGALKYKISRQSFEEQIKEISAISETHSIEKRNICLTFDDGGKSFLTVIAPILETYGFSGYFFITTKLINTAGFLTAAEIVELDNRGHYIGTHSHSHPPNISLLSFREIESEWTESSNILNDILKKPVEYASIPGGFFSSDSEKALFSVGVNVIFTSNPVSSIKFVKGKRIIGRFSIMHGMTTEEVRDITKSFSLIRFKLALKWNILKIVKLVCGRHYFKLRNYLIQN